MTTYEQALKKALAHHSNELRKQKQRKQYAIAQANIARKQRNGQAAAYWISRAHRASIAIRYHETWFSELPLVLLLDSIRKNR